MNTLSFDGCGINDKRNEYAPRVATFSRKTSSDSHDYAKEFGPMFAAAPDMLKALQAIHAALMYCPEYGAFFTDETGSAYPAGTTYQPMALAREAIAKATGKAL